MGLLGGSFNPAHEGHLHISRHAIRRLGLDAVWWLVSPQNPLKPSKGMMPFNVRLEEAMIVADTDPRIIATDIEHGLNTRYTVDTIAALKRLYPKTRFAWIMGTDNLHQIHLWKKWQKIFEMVPVCVVDRDTDRGRLRGCPAATRFYPRMVAQDQAAGLLSLPLPAWTILRTPRHPQSASKIREICGAMLD